MMDTKKEKVFSNLLWRFAERFGAQIISTVVSVVLARLLLPEDYGLIALVTVFVNILQVFVDSGMGNALIQKLDADDLDFSTVFYFNIAMCTVLYIGVFLAAPWIAGFYNNQALVPIIRAVALTLVISGVKNVQQAYVSKHLLFKKFFFSTLGGTITSAVVGIWLAYRGAGVWALVAQHLTNLVMDTMILWITVKWRPIWKFSWERWSRLFSYGWKLLVSALLETGYQNLHQLIIGKKYTPQDLAFFNRGQQFPNLLVINLNSSIDSVLLPTLSASQNDPAMVKRMTRSAIKTSSFVMWPIMVGLAVCAEPFVRLVLTEKWLFSIPYMRIFCFTFALYPIHTSNLNAIKAMGRSDIFLRLELEKKCIGILTLLATMWNGVLFMACGLVISDLISSFINAYPNKALLGYSYGEQLKDILPAAFLAGVMGAIVYLVTLLKLHDMLTLLIQIPLGVLVYVAGAKLFKMDSYSYVLGVLKQFLCKKK